MKKTLFLLLLSCCAVVGYSQGSTQIDPRFRINWKVTGITVDLFTNPLVEELPNSTSGGATLNKLACISSTGLAQTCTTSSTMWSGVAVGGAFGTTSGNTQIAVFGQSSLILDGSSTIGDYIQISSTSGGEGHDIGATYPTSGAVIGRVIGNNTGAGTAAIVYLFGPGIMGFGNSGTVSNCSTQFAFYYAASTGTVANCDPLLTDTGTTLTYSGTGGLAINGTGTSNFSMGVAGSDTGSYTMESVTGGSITLIPASAASEFTITVPAANDTLVNLAGVQALTNKTIDGVSPITMGYLDATSSIQTQLNSKGAAPLVGSVAITANSTAGTCTTQSTTVAGAQTSMVAVASAAGAYDSNTIAPQAFVSTTNTVTIQICTLFTDSSAPSITYNVRVIP